MSYRVKVTLLLSVLLVLITGCASLDSPETERAHHRDAFSAALAVKETEALKEPLTLEGCLEIAIRENYAVRRAELSRKLAELDRDAAFANFLPVVALKGGLMFWHRQPMAFGSFTQDKDYRDASAGVTLPILMPSTWFLYANRKLGISVSDISAHYVRQAMVLQVTSAFFNCLIQEDTIDTLKTQTEAAKSQYERVSGLGREGFAADWECQQALYQFKARTTELSSAKRALNTCKAALLQSMGLSPMVNITLDRTDIAFAPPAAELTELVMTALTYNPSLSIADHTIVMNENALRNAIADFLPTLSAFGTATWTTDSIAAYSNNLYEGLSAAWNIFSGFSSITGYKAAKLNRQSSMLDREATFISVILEVVKAHAALQDATEGYQLAETAFNSTRAKYIDYERKQKEGLIPVNDMLDAQADMDKAQASLATMKYQRHLALASLNMALGTIGGDFLKNHEHQK